MRRLMTTCERPYRQVAFRPIEELFDEFLQPAFIHEGFPPVNVWADEDKAVVTMEAPGIEAGAIDLEVKGMVLTIKGSRKSELNKDEASYYRRERWYGDFSRTVRIPWNVEQEKIEAALLNGVLSVTLHRAESEKPRKIQIK